MKGLGSLKLGYPGDLQNQSAEIGKTWEKVVGSMGEEK